MKKMILIVFIIFICFVSCISTGNNKKDYEKTARKMLRKIEEMVDKGDVEAALIEFQDYVRDKGLKLDQFITKNGNKLDEKWFEQTLKKGWTNEIYKNAKRFINDMENIDEAKLKKYGDEIKKYSKKLGFNIIDTVSLIGSYLKEEAIEFSKSDFIKKLGKIWKE